jgi:hypothetical protein
MEEDYDGFEVNEPVNVVAPENDYYSENPAPGDPLWNDYVMGLLEDNEVVNEEHMQMPICHGLRRLATQLLGKVTGGVKQIIYPDKDDPRRVAVIYEIYVEDKQTGIRDVYTEVASANLDNTDPFFLDFAEATASTKAESRALRKALLLKNVAADEVKRSDRDKIMGSDNLTPVSGEDTDGSVSEDSPISSKQIQFLDKFGKIGNINVDKFVKGKIGDRKLEDVTREEARDLLIKPLDSMANGREETPKELIGFKENWRNAE